MHPLKAIVTKGIGGEDKNHPHNGIDIAAKLQEMK